MNIMAVSWTGRWKTDRRAGTWTRTWIEELVVAMNENHVGAPVGLTPMSIQKFRHN